eukprot:sb/3467019/
MILTETYPLEPPLVYVPDYAGDSLLGVTEDGLLNNDLLTHWSATPILSELVDGIVTHIGHALYEKRDLSPSPFFKGGSVERGSSVEKSGSVEIGRNQDENKGLDDLVQVEKQELPPETTTERESFQQRSIVDSPPSSSLQQAPESSPGCLSLEQRLEMITAIGEELMRYRDEIEGEVSKIDARNDRLEVENEELREELGVVRRHLAECCEGVEVVRGEVAEMGETIRRMRDNVGQSVDNQVVARDSVSNEIMLLRAEGRALDDCLNLLTEAKKRKTIDLESFLSSCSELGRKKFLLRYKIKRLKELKKNKAVS